MFLLAAGICSLNYSCAVHLYHNLQVLSTIPFYVHEKAAFLQDKCTPKFLYISCKYKAFLQRHLYVLTGLEVGTKLIWPYAANNEESDRYCWQRSPSVTWHYSPIRTLVLKDGYGGALLVASGIHPCMVMVW